MTDTVADIPDVIRLAGVSKHFVVRKDNSLKERLVGFGRGRRHREDFWALSDLSLTIPAGQTVGLIGHNGSGKSTLLKVIGGILDPSTGTVERRGRVAALLELGAGFHPDLTGRENVYLNAAILGLSKEQTDERFADIVDFSGIGDFIDTQVKFYSSGMYVRLAFAVAVHTDPDLLLVDEVLAVGDEAFQRKCLDRIREFQEAGVTIIIVTHSLGQVLELCDRAILLERGRLELDGDPLPAVERFRDLLEQRRVAEIEAKGLPPAAPREIERVELGLDGDSLHRGEDLSIEVVLRSDERLSDWMVAVNITSVSGQTVFDTTTQRQGLDLAPLEGRARVRLSLTAPMLGGGKYFVSASLMTVGGVHLHDLTQAVSFDVPMDEQSFGSVWAESSMALEPIRED